MVRFEPPARIKFLSKSVSFGFPPQRERARVLSLSKREQNRDSEREISPESVRAQRGLSEEGKRSSRARLSRRFSRRILRAFSIFPREEKSQRKRF